MAQPLETVMHNLLLSPDNDTLADGKFSYELYKAVDLPGVLDDLVNLLTSPDEVLRRLAAIVLCDVLTSKPITEQIHHANLPPRLITCLSEAQLQDDFVLSKICKALNVIVNYEVFFLNLECMYLFNYIMDGVNSPNPRFVKNSLLAFSRVPHLGLPMDFTLQLPTLKDAFIRLLQPDNDLDTRIAALFATLRYLNFEVFDGHISDGSDNGSTDDDAGFSDGVGSSSGSDDDDVNEAVDESRELASLIMAVFNDALQDNQEAIIQKAMHILIRYARFFDIDEKGMLVPLIEPMLTISRNDNFEQLTRNLAVEYAISLVELNHCTPRSTRELLYSILDFLADIDENEVDDVEADKELHRFACHCVSNAVEDFYTEDDNDYDNHKFGVQCIVRLSKKTNFLRPIMSEVLKVYRDSLDWKKRRAAVTCLELIYMVWERASVKCFSNISKSIDDAHQRVQFATMNAMLRFISRCPLEYTAFLEGGVFTKLTTSMQVADLSLDQLNEHYDAVMPHLKNICISAGGLLEKATQYFNFVGKTVGEEKFKNDLEEVKSILASLKLPPMDADDQTNIDTSTPRSKSGNKLKKRRRGTNT